MRKQVEESAAAEGARRATGAAAERDRKGRFSARRAQSDGDLANPSRTQKKRPESA